MAGDDIGDQLTRHGLAAGEMTRRGADDQGGRLFSPLWGDGRIRDTGLIAGALLLSILLLNIFHDRIAWPADWFLLPGWHSLLEIFSIAVAALIFAIGWNTGNSKAPTMSVVITYGFLGVALFDSFHLLSFPGMPVWVTPAGAEKSIYFWLAARLLAAGVLLYAAVASWQPPRRHLSHRLLLWPMLLLVAGVCWLILSGQQLPQMYIPGEGVTALKGWCEQTVMALNLLAAFAFLARSGRGADPGCERFFLAVFTMALSESLFVYYQAYTDLHNVVGHVYKMLAYLFLYRAVFVELVRAPYLELERSEARLRNIRAELETLLNSAPDGVLVIDRLGAIVRVNPRLAAMFGYQPEALVRMPLALLIPGYLPQRRQNAANTAAPQPAAASRMEGLRHDGSRFPLDIAFGAVDPQAGGEWEIAIVRDIGEQLRMLEELRSSEARFRGYVENTPDWIWELDRDGCFVYSSPRVADLLGYSPQALLGKPLLQYPGVSADEPTPEVLIDALRFGRSVNALQLLRQHRDGHVVYLEISCIAAFDPAGKLSGFHCIGHDVSEHLRQQQVLQQNETRLRQAFDYASIGIALVSTDWRVLRANPALAALSGLGEAEFQQLNLRALLHPDDVDMLRHHVDSLAGGGGRLRHVELRLLHRRGHYLWVSVTAGWVPGSAGMDGHFVIQFIDVSQRREDEKRIRMLSSILDQTRDFVCMADPGGRLAYLNPSARKALGLKPEQPFGDLMLTDLHPPETARLLLSRVLPEVERKGSWEGDTVWQGRNGEPIPTLQTVQAHRNADGHVEYWSAIAHDIGERKRFETRLLHQATHDALTGLPNRSLLKDRLQMALAAARRNHSLLAVMFIDLDDFKSVNELYGHKTGDLLIEKVCNRLRAGLRDCDTLARQGGDSFVAVLTGIRFTQDIIVLAEKILSTLAVPIQIGERDVFVAASLGISVFPVDNDDADELLRKADVAVCRAKEQGRNGYQFYTADMDDDARLAIELEAELRRALARGELEMFYQPQIDCVAGCVVAAEALIRWRHPQRGLLLPGQFLPLAEKSGFIVSLGEWTINEACRSLVALEEEFGRRLQIAVNLSAAQLLQGDLPAVIAQALEQYSLPADRLQLEITEVALIRDPDGTQQLLQQLRERGVSIVLDDFGSGYSSLAYLKRFPVDALKIDRTLIADLGGESGDLPLVDAIIQLAGKRGMQVVAEGVETAAQLALLRQSGCRLMQGHHFSAALPFAEFAHGLVADIYAAGQPGGDTTQD